MKKCVWQPSLLALSLLSATGVFAGELLHADAPNAIPGQYIVVFKDSPALSGKAASVNSVSLASTLAQQFGGKISMNYHAVLSGAAMEMTEEQARRLASHPSVAFIEPDQLMHASASQNNATWGLDRSDQRDRPLNQTYNYESTASNVHAYIIDTGVRGTHNEFAGRMGNGYTAVNDGYGTNDCGGHGTHVAGTVGGTIYGIAKGVTIHPVRVLNCAGSGSTAGIVAGMDWVAQNRVLPAVANMSLGGGASTALDQGVARLTAAGVTTVVAAGNDSSNACNYSPARAPSAITVGSTTSSDAMSSFSNYGSCVDIFGPGSSVTSAWNSSNTSTNSISGTSMASPHVAGAAALYLAGNPNATVAQVTAALLANASSNKISGIPSGPNKLLYTIGLSGGGGGNTAPTAAFSNSSSGLTVNFTDGSSDNDGSIVARNWDFGDGTSSTVANPSKTYAGPGTYLVKLTVTDDDGATGTVSKSIAVSDGSGGECGTRYTGTFSGSNGQTQIQPNGTWYQSTSAGSHKACLNGPSGTDYDLYLDKWNGSSWVRVAQSISSSSSETINYSGSAGYYRFRVLNYRGSGDYSFELTKP